jgi:Barstar (barnase inhibitor)
MRDFNNNQFGKIMQQMEDSNEVVIHSEFLNEDMISLQYFLTRKSCYAVIVDDYPFEISDKLSLLEALYYQVRLITMYDLNWDSLQEGLADLVNNLLEFEGICLLFKKGSQLIHSIEKEFNTLSTIIQEINKHHQKKKIKVVII